VLVVVLVLDKGTPGTHENAGNAEPVLLAMTFWNKKVGLMPRRATCERASVSLRSGEPFEHEHEHEQERGTRFAKASSRARIP
jgi:hypothetical protein